MAQFQSGPVQWQNAFYQSTSTTTGAGSNTINYTSTASTTSASTTGFTINQTNATTSGSFSIPSTGSISIVDGSTTFKGLCFDSGKIRMKPDSEIILVGEDGQERKIHPAEFLDDDEKIARIKELEDALDRMSSQQKRLLGMMRDLLRDIWDHEALIIKLKRYAKKLTYMYDTYEECRDMIKDYLF